ncbi:DUF4365 domain-containing protein [Rhizobium leguminosarum]|uniref:DUF4365 domain-containing protein n=1 Tax=Rhizobium leguminosarum TaxID=384 RepID=UPI001C8FEE1E|nr:DUF4365 domain-containing protein [Rhizobium leguminosarum]MBY2941843.1 DUF4365 domain-containing protein [Rhizobium leguminosarum]
MKSKKSEAVSESGVGWLKYAVADRLEWIFREQPNQDKGVDAHVEEVSDGEATGRLIGMQIKSGASWFRERNKAGYVYRGDFEHLTYWRGHSLPILVVLFDPSTQTAYWQLVSEANINEGDRGWALTVPFENQINADAVPQWSRICVGEGKKAFLRKQKLFSRIAREFEREPPQRQALLYEALHATQHSLLVSTPYIDESILSVLDFMSAKCPVRLLVRPDQDETVLDFIEGRRSESFEVGLIPGLHAKHAVFDSLLLLTGSANLTPFALRHPEEKFCLIVDEASSGRALQLFFNQWHDASPPNHEMP